MPLDTCCLFSLVTFLRASVFADLVRSNQAGLPENPYFFLTAELSAYQEQAYPVSLDLVPQTHRFHANRLKVFILSSVINFPLTSLSKP